MHKERGGGGISKGRTGKKEIKLATLGMIAGRHRMLFSKCKSAISRAEHITQIPQTVLGTSLGSY